MSAKIYSCIKVKRKLVWSKGVSEKSPNTSGSRNGGNYSQGSEQPGGYSDVKYLYGKRIGDSCSKNGVFGFTGGGLAICRNHIVSYALQSDIPPTPSSGYRVRPNWYPTLAQQIGLMSEPTCSPSSVKFSSPVIPIDKLAPSIPYGAMIGGHVTPIDHAYLGLQSLYKLPSERTDSDYSPITSPANGVITSLGNLGSHTSIRVTIDHGCNVSTVYMVVNRLSGVLAQYASKLSQSGAAENVHIAVKAGQEFGEQRDNPLDFNVWDGTQWLSGFANPYSYLFGEAWKPYTADPLPFFTPTLRASIEAKFQRTSTPRTGKIDYDVAGTASGNWFLDGTLGYSGRSISIFANAKSELQGGQAEGKNDYSWSHLAIAPEQVDQSAWIFSIGWWQNEAGDPRQFMMQIPAEKPTPDKLKNSDGIVSYLLTSFTPHEPDGAPIKTIGSNAPYAVVYTLSAGAPQGVASLQVNNDGSLTVEVHPGETDVSKFVSFSAAKRIYQR